MFRAAPAAALAVATLITSASAPAGPPGGSLLAPVLSLRRDAPWIEATVAGQRLGAALAPLTGTQLSGSGERHGCVEVAQNGTVLYRLNGDQPVAPASNMKLLTATAALDVLGPGYRFTTEVKAVTSGHTVFGNLYLVGGGDPYLMTRSYHASLDLPEPSFTSLDQLAEAVKAAGITQITGAVVGDASRYDDQTSVPGWLPVYRTEGDVGTLGALEVNESFLPATGGASSGGTPVKEKASSIAPPKSPAAPAPGPTTTTTTLPPPPPSAPNPALFAAQTFAGLLRAEGISVGGGSATGSAPAGTPVVASIQSPSLADEISQMLNVSDDTAAELFSKEMGYVSRRDGSTAAGEAVVRDDLAADGLPLGGFTAYDASGLHLGDRITCDLIIAALERAGTAGPIASGLPVAARTGTLARRFLGTPAAGRMHAKTGTLNTVAALSGFVLPAPGTPTPELAQPIYFAIVADGPSGAPLEALVDKIAVAVAAYPAAYPLSSLQPGGR